MHRTATRHSGTVATENSAVAAATVLWNAGERNRSQKIPPLYAEGSSRYFPKLLAAGDEDGFAGNWKSAWLY